MFQVRTVHCRDLPPTLSWLSAFTFRWSDWTEDFVDVVLQLKEDADSNHTQGIMGLAVVAYRNLSKLLPERLILKRE